ncbi:hypothetical protein J2T04_001098 [Chryseobacterium lathyri]|uniref:Uncharacterized protein n=1 Tax=Chryseobacterium lathyri TaxID=395933 RepID=A0ABT9SIF5_9FLAO|nr:hypothetical protein [Chryseobacterium lathyri]
MKTLGFCTYKNNNNIKNENNKEREEMEVLLPSVGTLQ